MKSKIIILILGLTIWAGGCIKRNQSSTGNLPLFDHILVEVSDMNTSIAFYHDFLGLSIKSNDGHFAILQAGNIDIALWDKRWDWEKPHSNNIPPGFGMYPHLKVPDVNETVKQARQAGYKIIQKPRHYYWGTEAFIADPDGYIFALIN